MTTSEESSLLLGVVSDSHGHIPYTLVAARMLDSLGVRQVIHCGDIGSAEVPELFSAWPTHFVFGNVDGHEEELREAILERGLFCHERFGCLKLAGRKIAFLHGDDEQCLEETIHCGRFDLVCHGHTHVARWERIGRTWVLNPGALYRANPRSLAVVRLPELSVVNVPLS